MKIIKINKQIPSKENHFAIIDTRIPNKPGLYFLFDNEMELIYIGKTKCLRQRLVQHCSNKAIKFGEYENYPGTTYCEKGEVTYFSFIEIESKSERYLKELILLNIIKTKYNLKDKQIEESSLIGSK